VVFFETQHEAALHYIPADAHKRELIIMEIQYFVFLSQEKSTYHFLATDGSTNSTTLILQGCGEQPDQDFLTFMQ
jgi:hypothetical protein